MERRRRPPLERDDAVHAVDAAEAGVGWLHEDELLPRLAAGGELEVSVGEGAPSSRDGRGGDVGADALRPDLNARLRLYRGDLTRLRCDGLIVARAAEGRDSSRLFDRVMDGAGRKKVDEELEVATPPRSGEARVTHGYHLPCRHLVHVQRPRYPWRYRHAARVALQRSVRSALAAAAEYGLRTIVLTALWRAPKAEAQPFPDDIAAVLIVRALREVLEAHPHTFDVILLGVDDDDDGHSDGDDDGRAAGSSSSTVYSYWRDALQTFFPRTAREARELPRSLRHVKLADLDTSPPDKTSTAYAVPDYLDESGRQRQVAAPAAASAAAAAAATTTVAAKEVLSAEDELLRRYASDGMADLAAGRVVEAIGSDSHGGAIVLISALRVDVRQVDLQRLWVFTLRVCDEVAGGAHSDAGFSLAYAQPRQCRSENVLPLPWLWTHVHALLVRYRHRLRRMLVVGDWLVRAMGTVITFDLDDKLKEKMLFVSSVESMLAHFPGGRVRRSLLHDHGLL